LDLLLFARIKKYINEVINSDSFNNLESILQSIVYLTDGTIPISPIISVYVSNPTENMKYLFDISAFNNLTNKTVTFELHIAMPSTPVALEFPGNVEWINSPDMSAGDFTYCLVFRSMDGGGSWQGNLAYSYGGAQ